MGYSETEARQLVIKAGYELVEKGLIARTWGNISARIGYNKFVITPSGRDYMSLKPEDLVVVDLDGNYEGSIKPSSEKGVHAQTYRLRNNVNFVIHTHQCNASALSIIGKNIPLGEGISDETKAILGPKIVCAEYGLSSTKKLSNAVACAIEENPECNHVLMRYHGAVCFGKDYDSAFKVAFTLEALSGKIFEHYVGEKILTEPNTINKLELTQLIPELSQVIEVEDGADTKVVYQNDYEEMVILHAKTPYITKISELGEKMLPYSDDMAQIAGPIIYCASENASFEEIEKRRGKDSAIFIKGNGAYCYGINEEEANAVIMVLEKACQAAYLARKKNVSALKIPGAVLERIIYQKKYSKLKDK